MDNAAAGVDMRPESGAAPERAAPEPAPRRLFPPLSGSQAFRAAIRAFHDEDKPVSDVLPSITAVASKEPKGSPEHVEPTSIAAIYSIASNIIRKLRDPGFASGRIGETMNGLVMDMEDLFPEGSPLRRAVSEELSWAERQVLVYSLFFIHLDRTYFVHKGVRVPEPILAYLRRDDVRIHGVRYLKESLANLSKSDRPFTRHLELGFCLLSGDDSFELAELVEESTRTSNQGIDGTPNREAIERLEKNVRDSVASLHEEFTRMTKIGRQNGEGFSGELSRFLQRTETIVDHFGVFLNLMNWCMAPYAEEPAHRPFIALLRKHIDSMEAEIRTILNIVASIAKHYPAGSPNAFTRNGTLISILDMRTRLIRYTLVKIRLNTAPILFEQNIHKKAGETSENLALYRKETQTFDARLSSARTDLASIVRICGELSARDDWNKTGEDDQDNPVSSETADRVDQIIGQALASLSRDQAYAEREQVNLRRYQELCNRPYLAFTLGAYSPPSAEIDTAVESGVNDLFMMQEELAPERMHGMGNDWKTRRLRFIEEFAASPPDNPNTFRTTAENAYQLFRTLAPNELSDKLLLELVTLFIARLGSDTNEKQSRRTSLRVSFFLLETTRALRKRVKNGKTSPEADAAIRLLSDFVGNVSRIHTSSDTFGRICLELGRIHTSMSLAATRQRDITSAGASRDRFFECFGHAYHLHPRLMAVLVDMEEAEKRNILTVMSQTNVSGVPAEELAEKIHGEVMLRGAQERREILSRQFSDEIRVTVQELLESEGVSRHPEERAIANLEKRLLTKTLPEISGSVLHGLGTIHFMVLDAKDKENPHQAESLLAGVRSRKIARGRHITPLATYGGIIAFVEHDPMATERVKKIIRFEWLDQAMDDLCVSVVDLQDGLDVGEITDCCVNALVERNGSGMQNACTAWVIDPETGIAYAANVGKDKTRKRAEVKSDAQQRGGEEEESCYLRVTDADPSDQFESMRGTTIYSRQVFMKSTITPPPAYLRPGSTIMLYAADHIEYLRHLARAGLLDRDSARGAGIQATTVLKGAIPLIGTILKAEKNGDLVVNVTWPLTYARYHLATLRAKRNAGIPFLSTDIIREHSSLQAVLKAQEKDGRVVSSTIPNVSFAHERGGRGKGTSDLAVGRAVSFFGPDTYRIVFELPSKTTQALDSVLGGGGNMARPLRIIGDFRKALAVQIRMDCQKQGMVSAEEARQRIREIAGTELRKQVELEQEREREDGRRRKKEIDDLPRWFDSIVQVAERGLTPEDSYTAESLDDATHQSLEEMISRIAGYTAIFEALTKADWIGEVVASPSSTAIHLGGESFFPKNPEFDRLTPPVVTGGLVELSFRYEPTDESRRFIQKMRTKILEEGGGAKRRVL